MKTICKTNRRGYEGILEIGEEYEVLDIQRGTFAPDFYVQVVLPDGKKAMAIDHRFSLTKEQCRAYADEHHPDWDYPHPPGFSPAWLKQLKGVLELRGVWLKTESVDVGYLRRWPVKLPELMPHKSINHKWNGTWGMNHDYL